METDVTLLVSYVVSNASWSPAYDVRVFPITKEMKVGLNSSFYKMLSLGFATIAVWV